MKRIEDAKSLKEVWEWKDNAFQEVKNLAINKAVKKRLEDSIRNAGLIRTMNKNLAA